MPRPVKVAFASCSPALAAPFIEKFSTVAPAHELLVVSEFPPPIGRWIPYRVDRPWRENLARCRAALAGCHVVLAAVVLEPRSPYSGLRLLPWLFAPHRTLFYNQNLDHFTLRPRGLPVAARHVAWRLRENLTKQIHPGGELYTWLWRLRHPSNLVRPASYAAALLAGRRALQSEREGLRPDSQPAPAPDGVSVVIPSRNGRVLLERLLPLIFPQASEVILVDNGSDDGTAEWTAANYQSVRVIVTPEPLSFARAVNRGIAAARFRYICLLNNDMAPAPDFVERLRSAFAAVPDLFCATAQIFFPTGKRREETGKAVMRPIGGHRTTTEFPIHCIEPIAGEDLSYVLYGSGGCSLYDAAKLRALGCAGEAYEPAYVEDLDLGYRAWREGWPTVFVASAHTVHDHRTTTSRYYSQAELDRALETNYLKFVTSAVASPGVFRRLWRDAVVRLNLKAALEHDEAARITLRNAWKMPRKLPAPAVLDDEIVLGLGSGDIAVFPGRAERRPDTVVIATCYTPYPLSHGGAVRMYNLIRRAAAVHAQVLVTFVDELQTPPPELLDICVEIVQVRRLGSHLRPNRGLPDVVEEFDSAAFRGALQETIRKWSAGIVQLEFTQMAQYAGDCAPAKTVLVEHDITIDLYAQLLAHEEDWDTRRQLERWIAFESDAWRRVDCVVTMSNKDKATVQGARCVRTLPNGVDLERFRPSSHQAERRRLLFIGSFAHLPNLLALNFFLTEVWPHLQAHNPLLHVIAGSRPRYYFERSRSRLSFALDHPGLELQDFVADVRPAYEHAAVVIAPLLASAGTNIKIMEAMAMGKAIVSTSSGINGLDELTPGRDVLVENDGPGMARAIAHLFENPADRLVIEKAARATAERAYDWNRIAAAQSELYRELFRS